MIISINNKKIIFVHIPKTGGTSIEHFFGLSIENNVPNKQNLFGLFIKNDKQLYYQHLTINEILEFDHCNNYDFCFSIVRNPYDRAISEYNFLIGTESISFSFDDFLNLIILDPNGGYNGIGNHFMPQYKFVCDHDERIIVDKIFKFENFDSIFEYLKKEFDFLKNKNNTKTNVSPKIMTRKNLSKNNIDLINHIYAKDFEIFNYEKMQVNNDVEFLLKHQNL